MTTDTLISNLVTQSKQATEAELAQVSRHVAVAPFADDPLEVDEPLWGGFWQGDVIAPGYRLPAVELALLRAIRLDETWPETITTPQFLADLRQAILDPQAGIWTLTAAGQPCVVLAAPWENPKSITVVWYCASTGRLHAGYRTNAGEFFLKGATIQRGLESSFDLKPASQERDNRPAQAVEAGQVDDSHRLAARLDAEILRRRGGNV